MKFLPFAFCLLILALGSACKKPEPPVPVVHVKPVEVVPYEDGYLAGYAMGQKEAKPRDQPPAPESVEPMAHEEGAKDPNRDPKWERGFVAGYMAGFREKALGLK